MNISSSYLYMGIEIHKNIIKCVTSETNNIQQ